MSHLIVSAEEWTAARRRLLEEEKELTRMRDRVSAARRALPWVRVEKIYMFDTPRGPKTLANLFDGRSQLVVQHFMFAPDWDAGCTGCSFGADHIDGPNQHLVHHDVTYVAVARAPLPKLEAYRRRMGWRFPFVSSARSDFNYDFKVSFRPEELAAGMVTYNYQTLTVGNGVPAMEDLPGVSVFFQGQDGTVYHTYSSYGRGNEEVIGTYMLLDLTPKGRNENGPHHNLMDWARRHDEYDETPAPSCCHEEGQKVSVRA